MRIDNKIKVFISSNCNDEKFKEIRKEIKQKLDDTELVSTYLFEAQASTLPTEVSYCLKVEDSDVCVFLLEDADIPVGVQKEILRAKNTQKKSFYYFLGKTAKDVITLQHSLIESKRCVFHIVDSFDDFIQCIDELVGEIADIYHYYCMGMIIDKYTAEEQYTVNDTNYSVASKSILKNSDKCKDYLSRFVFNDGVTIRYTDDFDMYCSKFLDIMFANKSISDFNVSLFLENLKNKHSKKNYNVIQERWNAIQKYFLGDKDGCLNSLNNALATAKNGKLPEWIIKDILIDIRNMKIMIHNESDQFEATNDVEIELSCSQTPIFYPVLDRCDKQFYDELLSHHIKEKLKSPYTVSFGSGLDRVLDNIVSAYMVAMLYGSLTYIRGIYNRLRYCVFYLCNNYSNWSFRLALCKLMVVASSSKDVERMIDVFNDILDNINDVDANGIYNFAMNIPTKHERSCAILSAFSNIGYYLNDANYSEVEKNVVDIMNAWQTNLNSIVGQVLFRALIKNAERMDQNKLLQFSIDGLKKNFEIYYPDILKLLSNLDYRKCDGEKIKELVNILKEYLAKDGQNFYDDVCFVLVTLFNSRDYKDDSIIDVLREKHNSLYRQYFLPNTTNDEEDFQELLRDEIVAIHRRNETQGKNGLVLYSDNPYDVINNIINMNVNVAESEVIEIINVCFETITSKGQPVSEKINAIKVLLSIYKDRYVNELIYELCRTHMNSIDESVYEAKSWMSNLSSAPLRVGMFLFKVLLSFDYSPDINYVLGSIISSENIADQISVTQLLNSFLSHINYFALSEDIKVIIKNIIITSLQSYNKDLRYWALNALLKLLPYEGELCLKNVYEGMNNGNCYEKQLIIQHAKIILSSNKDAYSTIIEKGLMDSNFMVRLKAAKANA